MHIRREQEEVDAAAAAGVERKERREKARND